MKGADVVITGEGAIDESSLMGKGVGEVTRLCRELGLPCIGLAGNVSDAARASGRFAVVKSLAPGLTDVEEAQARAAYWLESLAATVARDWPGG